MAGLQIAASIVDTNLRAKMRMLASCRTSGPATVKGL